MSIVKNLTSISDIFVWNWWHRLVSGRQSTRSAWCSVKFSWSCRSLWSSYSSRPPSCRWLIQRRTEDKQKNGRKRVNQNQMNIQYPTLRLDAVRSVNDNCELHAATSEHRFLYEPDVTHTIMVQIHTVRPAVSPTALSRVRDSSAELGCFRCHAII